MHFTLMYYFVKKLQYIIFELERNKDTMLFNLFRFCDITPRPQSFIEVLREHRVKWADIDASFFLRMKILKRFSLDMYELSRKSFEAYF